MNALLIGFAVIGGLTIAVCSMVAFFKACDYLFKPKRAFATEIKEKDVEILRIYRHGYQIYTIFCRDENNEILERWCSFHAQTIKLFMDVPQEKEPWAHLTLERDNQGFSPVSTEIHIRSMEDISFGKIRS